MIRLDLDLRERLDEILPEQYYNYCLQCGACVADCPGHLYVEEFNPREIVLKVLLGQLDELTRADSIIWKCTNCYTCFDRCPQDVRPIEIIIGLKNLAVSSGKAPKQLNDMLRTVRRSGRALPVSSLVEMRRKELGLAEIPSVPLEEIRRLEEGEGAEGAAPETGGGAGSTRDGGGSGRSGPGGSGRADPGGEGKESGEGSS